MVGPNQAPEGEGVERRGDHHRPARREGGEGAGHQPVHVEQRHHAEGDIGSGQLVGVHDVGHRDRHVAVAERNPLGPAGAATGMEHEGDVFGDRLPGQSPPG